MPVGWLGHGRPSVGGQSPPLVLGTLSGQAYTIFTPTVNVSFTTAVAYFLCSDGDINPADFAASINWGDGTAPTAGVLSGQFIVTGTHTYTAMGTFTTTITISALNPVTNSPLVLTGSATLTASAGTLSGVTFTNTPVVNVSTTMTMGQFQNSNGDTNALNYTVDINWGDGSAHTAGVLDQWFDISGTHTYTTVSSFTKTITITDVLGAVSAINSPLVLNSTSNVQGSLPALGTLTGSALTINPTVAVAFTLPVASFADSDGNTLTTRYTVDINWGDGSAHSVGALSGTFSVAGTHTYAAVGTFTTTVTITDLDAATNSPFVLTGSASVTNAVVAGTGARARCSIYPGDGDSATQTQETKYKAVMAYLSGRKIPYVLGMTDTTSPSAFNSSAWGEFLSPSSTSGGVDSGRSVYPAGTTHYVSISNTEGGYTMAQVAAGALDANYDYMAGAMKSDSRHAMGGTAPASSYDGGGTNPSGYIRLGWEFSGNWYLWSVCTGGAGTGYVQQKATDYIAAYQHIRNRFVVTNGMTNLKFFFCGATGCDNATTWGSGTGLDGRGNGGPGAYPGDAYVDVVGTDPYDGAFGLGLTGIIQQLNFAKNFALQRYAATGKVLQIGLGEWASQSALDYRGTAYVNGILDWCDALPASGPASLAIQSYFNQDLPNGNFSLASCPNARAAWVARMR